MTEDLISCFIQSLEETNLYEVLKQKNRQLLVAELWISVLKQDVKLR